MKKNEWKKSDVWKKTKSKNKLESECKVSPVGSKLAIVACCQVSGIEGHVRYFYILVEGTAIKRVILTTQCVRYYTMLDGEMSALDTNMSDLSLSVPEN